MAGAFDAQLRQSATLYHKTGRDRYGKPVYGAAGTVIDCRFDAESPIKLMKNEQETTVDAYMLVDEVTAVNDSDRILGPDGNYYRVVLINNVPDRFGDLHHIEVGLNKWQI